MSSDSPVQTNLMFAGMALGGTVISLLGAGAHYVSEKEIPKTKAIFRDFIIGAVLVLLLLQLVPDSISSLMASLPSMKSLVSGGGGSVSEIMEHVSDMNIQTGVPGF